MGEAARASLRLLAEERESALLHADDGDAEPEDGTDPDAAEDTGSSYSAPSTAVP